MWWVWLVFCDCGFHSICPLTHNDKRLTEGETDWGKLDLVLMDRSCSVKYWIQFSVDHQGCVPSMLFDLRSNYGRGNDTTVSHSTHTSARDPCTIHRQVWLSLLWGHCSFPLAHGAHKVLFVPSKSLFPQSCGSSVIKSHWPPMSNCLGVLSPFARSPGW